MGRQYVRQRFSNASWAAGDSPCASSTTLQCVVVNIAAPPDAEPVALSEVTSSAAALTLESQSKGVLKASLHVTKQTSIRGAARRCTCLAPTARIQSQPGATPQVFFVQKKSTALKARFTRASRIDERRN